jgi:hypothetical protein
MNMDLEPNGVEPQRTNPGSTSQEDDYSMQPILSVETGDAIFDQQKDEAFQASGSTRVSASRFI